MASEAKLKLVLLLVRGKAYFGGSVFLWVIILVFGVIMYCESGDGCFDILIVKTLGEWVLPKGTLLKDRSHSNGSTQAYEEAGISGKSLIALFFSKAKETVYLLPLQSS